MEAITCSFFLCLVVAADIVCVSNIRLHYVAVAKTTGLLSLQGKSIHERFYEC